MLAAIALMLLSTTAPSSVALEFEFKLQYRGPWRTGVDQWARGVLELEVDDGEHVLVAPLEDPWVLRWYPRSGELKLGSVEAARVGADPYSGYAPRRIAQAERLAKRWWRDDPGPTGAVLPPWADRVAGFWSSCRRGSPPELASEAVYPFHVLGPFDGRLRFTVEEGGALDARSIVERVSAPWVAAGEGAQVGYGAWMARRPRWEPALYQAIAAALELLDWPLTAGASFRTGDVLERAAAVAATLNPRAAGKLDWHGGAFGRAERLGPHVVFDSGEIPFDRGAWRLWRASRYVDGETRPRDDDLQLLIDGDCGLRAWLRIGYRELQRSAIASSSSR